MQTNENQTGAASDAKTGAPRVTRDDIHAKIRSEHYFTAADAVTYNAGGPTVAPDPELRLLTICVLVLHNGFTVTGESACVSPGTFDANIGRQIAFASAVDKIWPLLGYQLKDELHRCAMFDASEKVGYGPNSPMGARPPHQQRVLDEKAELDGRIRALHAFIEGNATFSTLPEAEQSRLRSQAISMTVYSDILAERIAAF